jgi:hypothetical protein
MMADHNGTSIPREDPTLWFYWLTTLQSDDATKTKRITFCDCDRSSKPYIGADGLRRCNACHLPAVLAPPP